MQVNNGEMKVRIGEVFLSVVTGIVTWWCWEPSTFGLYLGLCAYGVLLLCCHYSRPARMMVWVRLPWCSVHYDCQRWQMQQINRWIKWLHNGWVVKSIVDRHWFKIIASDGWSIFIPSAPKQGSLVSVWHQPKLGLVHWDGGIDPVRRVNAERMGARKAKEWIVHSDPNVFKSQSYLHSYPRRCFVGAHVWWQVRCWSRVETQFQRTGTSHLFISGMHIGLWQRVHMRCCAGSGLGCCLTDLNWWALDVWIKRIALIGSVVVSVWYGHQ